jgi:hypothetical protein
MFSKGDKIHTHDGQTHLVRKAGRVPKMGQMEMPKIRGFVRGALVDCLTGEERVGDWHENVITTYGHGLVVRNFVGLAGSTTFASFWGIGYHTNTNSALFSSMNAIDSTEYGLHSSGGVSRATVSAGSQTLSGTWTLSQSYQYASTQIAHASTVNCIAQYANSSVGAGTACSLATFASSTKGTTQALNITYNWVFST